MPATDLLLEVRRTRTLTAAWHQIQENGRTSASKQVRAAIKKFASQPGLNIRKLSSELQSGAFDFGKAIGVAIKKKKGIRPLVIAQLESRIVQRALLDVMQENIPEVIRVLNIPTSFGGIKDKGVPEAIEEVRKSMKNGQGVYYVCSDIEGFFQKLPQTWVVNKVREWVPDKKFSDFFKKSIKVELENMAQLGKKAASFPIYEIGVAQGNCLSPLIGNLFLEEFDRMMNQNGLLTLRYIDDIIILGKDEGSVRRGYERAKKWLGDRGFRLFDPFKKEEKCSWGKTKDHFDFLGCEFIDNRVRPTLATKKRLMEKLSLKLIDERLPQIATGNSSFSEIVVKANGILHGWACHYWFCDDALFFKDLDRELTDLWKNFRGQYQRIWEKADGDLAKRISEGFESVTQSVNEVKAKNLKASPTA